METSITDYRLSESEKRVISAAAATKAFTNSPVPKGVMAELKDDFCSFVSIPYFRGRQLENLYSTSNIEEIIQADWEESLSVGAIYLYNEDTVTFATHIANDYGAAVKISIRRSDDRRGNKPWYLSYVPNDIPSAKITEAQNHIAIPHSDPTDLTTERIEKSAIGYPPDPEFIIPESVDFYYKPDEYAYAKIEKYLPSDNPEEYESKYLFRCIDGVSTARIVEKIVVERFGSKPEVGTYCWLRFKNLLKSDPWGSRYRAYLRDRDPGNQEFINREHRVFCEHRAVGDRVMAPIVATNSKEATVEIGPNTTIRVPLLSRFTQPETLIGKIGFFEIMQLGNVGSIELKFVEDRDPKVVFKDRLPDNLSSAIIPPVILDVIHSTELDEDSAEALKRIGIDLQTITSADFKNYANQRYLAEKDLDKVYVSYRDGLFSFDFDLGIRTSEGAPISACFKKDHSNLLRMNLFGFTSASRPFWRDVSTMDEDRWKAVLEELANLAMGNEMWDEEGDDQVGKKRILRSYLVFTYYKSWLDNLIVEGPSGDAIFDTGLVDENYDNIYCYLKRNQDGTEGRNRKWVVGYFACWGKGKKGKTLTKGFPRKPNPPEYIDRNHLEDLILDTSKEIFCDWEHIVDDNFSRLPLDFLDRVLGFNHEIRNLIQEIRENEDEADRRKLKEIAADGGYNQRLIISALRQAQEVAEKYVRWNYKTAVPIYWARKNRLSLLLPLNLCSPNNAADLALVVSPGYIGGYQGETILTINMAYKDARLVCRPCSEWLNMRRASFDDAEEAE